MWIIVLRSDSECEPLGAYSSESDARDAARRLECSVVWVPLDEDPVEIAVQSFIGIN